MGASHAPREPVVFLKPTTSYIRNGESILLPPNIGEVHHELELGVSAVVMMKRVFSHV